VEEIKRSEIQAIKAEDKKITDEQTIAETFNEYSVDMAENVKRQSKKTSLMMIMMIWIVIPISWIKHLINITQVWNVNDKQQKKLNKLSNPSKQNTHMGMTR
jgi:hypothetical protein